MVLHFAILPRLNFSNNPIIDRTILSYTSTVHQSIAMESKQVSSDNFQASGTPADTMFEAQAQIPTSTPPQHHAEQSVKKKERPRHRTLEQRLASKGRLALDRASQAQRTEDGDEDSSAELPWNTRPSSPPPKHPAHVIGVVSVAQAEDKAQDEQRYSARNNTSGHHRTMEKGMASKQRLEATSQLERFRGGDENFSPEQIRKSGPSLLAILRRESRASVGTVDQVKVEAAATEVGSSRGMQLPGNSLPGQTGSSQGVHEQEKVDEVDAFLRSVEADLQAKNILVRS